MIVGFQHVLNRFIIVVAKPEHKNVQKHSPSISYSSYNAGNTPYTCLYHSCRHPNISGRHRFPTKISTKPWVEKGRKYFHLCVNDGKLTSMHGFMSPFLTLCLFLSIRICTQINNNRFKSFMVFLFELHNLLCWMLFSSECIKQYCTHNYLTLLKCNA